MKLFLLTLLAVAASASIAPLFTDKDRIDGSYIVVLKDGTSLDYAIKSVSNFPFFTTLGGRITKRYVPLNGFAAALSPKILTYVRSLDFVKYVEEDGIQYIKQVASWGLDRIDQSNLPLNDQYSPRGNGLGAHVYVIDTGINKAHVDFGGRASTGSEMDFRSPNRDGIDCHGHGSHCAGTTSGTTYGVASQTNVYGIRVMSCLGSGSKTDIIAGMQWVQLNHNSPAVASMSIGGSPSISQDNVIRDMNNAGIPVVVAAGNDDADACDGSPSRAPDAFTVGATDNSDARASFSNYGSCVNIFAPGVSITSCWDDGDTAENTISGTSMATPHVAGAAAVVYALNPSLSADGVKNVLSTDATAGVVTDDMGTINKLLYIA